MSKQRYLTSVLLLCAMVAAGCGARRDPGRARPLLAQVAGRLLL